MAQSPANRSLLVMKFGGTSVADAERIRHVAQLVLAESRPVVVVSSALGGVTDELIRAGELARTRQTADLDALLENLAGRHRETAEGITEDEPVRERLIAGQVELLTELGQLLQGIQLVGEVSSRSADLLVSFGERLAVPLVAAAINVSGGRAAPVDSRRLLRTQPGFGGPAVDHEASRLRTREYLLPMVGTTTAVVTGFIASDAEGTTTTLGRGGSDYSATLVGAFLDAAEIWIWTDVDGVMTADPRVVPEARILQSITYREAAEMAYFGSRVLHPRTMVPAVSAHIPVLIRNTFRPELPGTRIDDTPSDSRLGVKTVTSVANLALVTIEGNGMIGVPGVVQRVFATTARLDANVYLVSQASSEHNITFVVHESDGRRVVDALSQEFEAELHRAQIDRIDTQSPVGIVAIIGEGMRGTPGIAQRLFTALGRAHINVLAIAQGSSELNVSVVVDAADLRRAVGATHSRFGLTRDTHLFIMGKGTVGRALIRQIAAARPRLVERHGIGLEVIGVCGRDELLLDLQGLDDEKLRAIGDGSGLVDLGGELRPDDASVFQRIAESRWLDVVIIDATAEDNGELHADALRHSFHLVTANKKPVSGPLATYDEILETAIEHGGRYQFETTFGAGLPALSTLQELLATCDEVRRVTGCFSGTLGHLCSALDENRPFSEAVREAHELGFTEPDPRDDLRGLDVARKAVIIARQLGARIELDDVELEPMLSPELQKTRNVDEFMRRLDEMDVPMRKRAAEAAENECVLRYIADITPDSVQVGLRAVPRSSPAGQLAGPDNILVFETDRYRENPLVIRGPGAGAEVTAAGVLGDILKIVRGT